MFETKIKLTVLFVNAAVYALAIADAKNSGKYQENPRRSENPRYLQRPII
jgi:hypothetical protein